MERSCKSILKQFSTRPAQLKSCATEYVKQVVWSCMQETEALLQPRNFRNGLS